MRITQQVASGAFFAAFGAAYWWLAADLPAGTAADMGVGYVPRILAVGMIGIGIVLLALALAGRPGVLGERVTIALRPLVLVTLVTAGFAALLPWLGLPLTVVATVLAAIVSGERFHLPTLLAIAVALAALTTALFAWGLKLQLPVLPHGVAL